MKALILLAEGLEEIEAVTPIDLLRRAGIEVTTASIGLIDVPGAHNIVIRADKLLDDALKQTYDILILPGGGGGTKHLSLDNRVLQLVKKQYNEGRYVAAICAAPTVLQKAGILEDHEVTSYPGTDEVFNKEKYRTDRVVRSGKVITSRGPATAFDFALEIIGVLKGDEVKDNIKKETIY